MLEGIAGPPDQAALAMPGIGARASRADARRAQHRAVRRDGGRQRDGLVREVGGRPLVRYDLHRDDAERLRRGFALLADIWWAAGRARSSCR